MSEPGRRGWRAVTWRQIAGALAVIVVAVVLGVGNAVDPAALDSSTSTAASAPATTATTSATTATTSATTATTSATTTTAGSPVTRAAASGRWVPPPNLTWYWQLQGTPRLEPVLASDLDGFATSATTVARFHASGQHVICYVDAGTWERWRPDAGRFPQRVLGRPDGWPGERWLDIRALAVLEPIMRARLSMCARKRFDAVEPDNLDVAGNRSGFAVTAGQQLRYARWIAATAHGLGLAVFQKNDPQQAAQLQPAFDGVLDEQCNQYGECAAFLPYLRAHKPVLDAEYERALYPGFCARDRRLGIMGTLYGRALDGRLYRPCA